MAKQDMEPRRILCVGTTPCLQRTLRFPVLRIGQVNRASSVTLSSGGKAINVARAAVALQQAPLVVAFAGGETGTRMVSTIQASGIEPDIVWTGQATRVCTTLIDEATGDVTELVEEAPLPGPEEWSALDERLSLLLAQNALMVVAGAPPPGAPLDVYAGFARRAREAGTDMLIDARGPVLMETLPYAPLLVKMNDQELAATCGRPVDSDEALRAGMRSQITRGARWSLVTRGRRDAWLLSETAAWRFRPPAVDVVNPIGSGDAATAGIAAGLRAGRSMPDAVRLGIACGSAAAAELVPGVLDAGLADRLVPAVGVTETTSVAGMV